MAWTALIPIFAELLDKVLPDAKQAADAKTKLVELAQAGELAALNADTQIALGQSATNQEDARSGSNFRGGWRPAIGWVCAVALAYQFLLRPLLPWILAVAGKTVPVLPALEMESLMALVFGILGLGTMRTVERLNGKIK